MTPLLDEPAKTFENLAATTGLRSYLTLPLCHWCSGQICCCL